MEFETVIGLEIHSELKTLTKNFCSCKNEFGSRMNSNVCPVCLGLPGALPVPNKTAFEYCIKTGLAFNCDINDMAIFERKNYFYPDNPKNFQITQSRTPIGYDGYVEIDVNGEKKKIEILEMILKISSLASK